MELRSATRWTYFRRCVWCFRRLGIRCCQHREQAVIPSEPARPSQPLYEPGKTFSIHSIALQLNICKTSDTCIAVSQNSFDSLDTLATAILGPGVVLTTSTLSPSSTPTSTSSKSVTSTSSSSSGSASSGTDQAGQNPANGIPKSKNGLSTPALVGTVVGVVLVVISASISGCAFYMRFAKKRKRSFLSEVGRHEGYAGS